MIISRRKAKHIRRVVEMQTIMKLYDEGKATPEQINRCKKLMLLERGQYDPKQYSNKDGK